MIGYARNAVQRARLLSVVSSIWLIGKLSITTQVNIRSSRVNSTIDIGIYIPNDKDYFERLKAHSEEISDILGEEAEWREARKACRLLIIKPLETSAEANWPQAFDYYMHMAPLFKKVAKLEK